MTSEFRDNHLSLADLTRATNALNHDLSGEETPETWIKPTPAAQASPVSVQEVLLGAEYPTRSEVEPQA